jgi:hypothetical protein
MVLYTCDICNFSTNKTTNYHRHLQTKKHIKNINDNSNKNYIKIHNNSLSINHMVSENNCVVYNIDTDNDLYNKKKLIEYPQVSTSIQSEDTEKFLCDYCNKMFTHKNNYYRHMKHRCRKKIKHEINSNVSVDDYKDLVNKLLESQNKLVEEKDKRIKEKDDTLSLFINNNILSNNITNNTTYNQTNNTLNNTNYVLNYINYSEADSMDSIKDQFKLTRDEFIKASLTNGYRGALMEKAENIIIRPYFDMESKRPMQTVDISRKKALYKDDINNNWTFNPKTTLDQCFRTFHNSAIDHQDQTIKENSSQFIMTNDENLYKQTYFIPTEIKQKEQIYREVKNHIYQKTKIKRDIDKLIEIDKTIEKITDGNSEKDFCNLLEDYTVEEEYIEKNSEEIFDCGRRYLYNKKTNIVYDPTDNYKCIGKREYNKILNNYYINYDE